MDLHWKKRGWIIIRNTIAINKLPPGGDITEPIFSLSFLSGTQQVVQKQGIKKEDGHNARLV